MKCPEKRYFSRPSLISSKLCAKILKLHKIVIKITIINISRPFVWKKKNQQRFYKFLSQNLTKYEETSIYKKFIKVFRYSRVSIFHEINFAWRQISVLIRFIRSVGGKRNLDGKRVNQYRRGINYRSCFVSSLASCICKSQRKLGIANGASSTLRAICIFKRGNAKWKARARAFRSKQRCFSTSVDDPLSIISTKVAFSHLRSRSIFAILFFFSFFFTIVKFYKTNLQKFWNTDWSLYFIIHYYIYYLNLS